MLFRSRACSAVSAPSPAGYVALLSRISGAPSARWSAKTKWETTSRVKPPSARFASQEAAPIFAPLSPREVEILDNIARGMTNKQVAYALSISEQTVKNHMSSILRKLSVNDRTQAVVYAMKQGWIRIPED